MRKERRRKDICLFWSGLRDKVTSFLVGYFILSSCFFFLSFDISHVFSLQLSLSLLINRVMLLFFWIVVFNLFHFILFICFVFFWGEAFFTWLFSYLHYIDIDMLATNHESSPNIEFSPSRVIPQWSTYHNDPLNRFLVVYHQICGL